MSIDLTCSGRVSFRRAAGAPAGHAAIVLGLLLVLGQAHAQDQFAQCIDGIGVAALDRGVSAATIERILPHVALLERVIRADRNQPEFVQTFGRYLGLRVNDRRVATGRALYAEHAVLLRELAARTGVPGQYLVALWGLESNFGGFLGDVPVFDSLATLACDRRRSGYFTTELINALQIVDDGHAQPDRMIGSWARAMGQTQFMPSVYLGHASDGDGDGVIDVWGSAADALASAAAYLGSLGWQPGYRWGREVLLPEGFDYSLAGLDLPQPLESWRDLGVADTGGNPVGALGIDARLLVPAGSEGPAFLVYDNFDVIMRWNRSEHFALTIGHLADRIAGASGLRREPINDAQLSSASLRALQSALAAAGYDPGPADGILGPGTRAAIRAYQSDQGLVADGYPNATVMSHIGID